MPQCGETHQGKVAAWKWEVERRSTTTGEETLGIFVYGSLRVCKWVGWGYAEQARSAAIKGGRTGNGNSITGTTLFNSAGFFSVGVALSLTPPGNLAGGWGGSNDRLTLGLRWP